MSAKIAATGIAESLVILSSPTKHTPDGAGLLASLITTRLILQPANTEGPREQVGLNADDSPRSFAVRRDVRDLGDSLPLHPSRGGRAHASDPGLRQDRRRRLDPDAVRFEARGAARDRRPMGSAGRVRGD